MRLDDLGSKTTVASWTGAISHVLVACSSLVFWIYATVRSWQAAVWDLVKSLCECQVTLPRHGMVHSTAVLQRQELALWAQLVQLGDSKLEV